MTTRAEVLQQWETQFIDFMKKKVGLWLQHYTQSESIEESTLNAHITRLNLQGVTWVGDHVLVKKQIVDAFYAEDAGHVCQNQCD